MQNLLYNRRPETNRVKLIKQRAKELADQAQKEALFRARLPLMLKLIERVMLLEDQVMPFNELAYIVHLSALTALRDQSELTKAELAKELLREITCSEETSLIRKLTEIKKGYQSELDASRARAA
jgi:hypothetical protein